MRTETYCAVQGYEVGTVIRRKKQIIARDTSY